MVGMKNPTLPSPGGRPDLQNNYRLNSRSLDRMVNGAFRVGGKDGSRLPRKRKKYLYRMERPRYRELVLSVAQSLADRDTQMSKGQS